MHRSVSTKIVAILALFLAMVVALPVSVLAEDLDGVTAQDKAPLVEQSDAESDEDAGESELVTDDSETRDDIASSEENGDDIELVAMSAEQGEEETAGENAEDLELVAMASMTPDQAIAWCQNQVGKNAVLKMLSAWPSPAAV